MNTAFKQPKIKSVNTEINGEIAQLNMERIKIFTIVLSLVGFVLIIVDHILQIDFTAFAFQALYGTHWYFFLLNLTFMGIYYLARGKRWGNTLVFALCLGMGVNGAVVAGIPDTILGRGVIAFNVSMLAISVFTYLLPIFAVIIYSSSFLLFLIFLLNYQPDSNILAGNLINSAIITVLSLAYSIISLRRKKKEIEQGIIIREQSKEIERLLNNILPTSIVSEIKKDGKTNPKHMENVTIGFIDFVSFSKIAARVSPDFIVKKLNYFFSKFDQIIKDYNLEKLKTIGDGYMFAGGLFSNDDQLQDMLLASLAIIRFVEKVNKEEKDQFEWKVRIGIHSGPVVAGIIGEWRFIYDVWGDTVNIASRLESASEPNRINVSHNVYEATKSHFSYEKRGILPVKNMEPIDMYFVLNTDVLNIKINSYPHDKEVLSE